MKNRRLSEKWKQLFSDSFLLGTAASDNELTFINQNHIYPLLRHTPEVPLDLLPKDEDGEEEGHGEQGEEGEEGEDGEEGEEGEEGDEVWDNENNSVNEEEYQDVGRGYWTDEEESAKDEDA